MKQITLLRTLGVLIMAGLVMGCGLFPAKVTVLIAGDLSGSVVKGAVPIEDIKSLKVTVTEVAVDYAGAQTEKSQLVVFSGEKEIDVLNLVDVSDLLSTATLPEGHYTKIRLAISNPILVLNAEPDVEITDIQLTANGHLFVSESFDLVAGESSLILLDFEGLHLVETGNGSYTWTPQLRATIDVTSAAVQTSGAVTAIDATAGAMTVEITGSDPLTSVQVTNLLTAQIFLPTDTDTPNGTVDSILVGSLVTVDGTINAAGTQITASAVHITQLK